MNELERLACDHWPERRSEVLRLIERAGDARSHLVALGLGWADDPEVPRIELVFANEIVRTIERAQIVNPAIARPAYQVRYTNRSRGVVYRSPELRSLLFDESGFAARPGVPGA